MKVAQRQVSRICRPNISSVPPRSRVNSFTSPMFRTPTSHIKSFAGINSIHRSSSSPLAMSHTRVPKSAQPLHLNKLCALPLAQQHLMPGKISFKSNRNNGILLRQFSSSNIRQKTLAQTPSSKQIGLPSSRSHQNIRMNFVSRAHTAPLEQYRKMWVYRAPEPEPELEDPDTIRLERQIIHNQQQMKHMQKELEQLQELTSTQHRVMNAMEQKLSLTEQNLKHAENTLNEAQQRLVHSEALLMEAERNAKAAQLLAHYTEKYDHLVEQKKVELQNMKDFAISGFSKHLLDVADHLERCLDHVPAFLHDPKNPLQKAMQKDELFQKFSEFYGGVTMTWKELMRVFEKNHVIRWLPEVEGDFDPQTMSAIFTVQTKNREMHNKVAQVLKTGYFIKNRVLRAAEVAVFVYVDQ